MRATLACLLPLEEPLRSAFCVTLCELFSSMGESKRYQLSHIFSYGGPAPPMLVGHFNSGVSLLEITDVADSLPDSISVDVFLSLAEVNVPVTSFIHLKGWSAGNWQILRNSQATFECPDTFLPTTSSPHSFPLAPLLTWIGSSFLTAFVFDCDGVLADTLQALYDTYAQFLEINGVSSACIEEFTTLNGPTLPQIVHILKEKYQLPSDEATLLQKYQQLLQSNVAQVKMVPHFAEEVLHKCCAPVDRPCAIASSSPKELVLEHCERFGIRSFFSAVCSSMEVASSKPAPDVYLLARKRLAASVNLPAATCYVGIDDSPLGIQAAMSAGMHTIWFTAAALPVDETVHAKVKVKREGGGSELLATCDSVRALAAVLGEVRVNYWRE